MKIAYNPKTAAALTTAPANNDITFDLRGLNIFVRGERFKGTDTTYSVFKKHTSAGSGGYNGLVPVPSYTATNIRFLREDGTWSIPATSIYIQLTNQDLDDYLDEGKWYYAGGGNSVTNKPSGVDAFELYVGRNANGYRYQKLITSNGIIWFRYYDSTAWKTWVRWYTDQNTDQKVLQSATTTANFRPVILGYTNTNTPSGLGANVTQQVYTTTTIYAQPSTGSLWANKLYSGGKPVLTEHQSLANYVTLNTAQTITGTKTFSRQQKFTVATGTSPFTVSSTTVVSNLNADMLDGWHLSYILKDGYVTSGTAGLSSYWRKVWDITLNSQYNDVDINLLVHSAYNQQWGIISFRLRQNGTGTAKNISAYLAEVVGNIPLDRFRLYYNNSSGLCQLWCNPSGQYNVYNYRVLAKTWKTGTEATTLGTFYTGNTTTAQSLPSGSYVSMTGITIVNTAAKVANTLTFSAGKFSSKTYNGSSAITVNVPTCTSHLTNDSGFLTGNVIRAVSANGYWGMARPDSNTSDWIRTTSSGIIPYQSGGRGAGHCGLGNSSWYFSSAYIDTVHGNLDGTATNADKLDGFHANTSQNPFGKIPTVTSSGVMEVGRYLDFHYNSSDTSDYRTRLQINHSSGSYTALLPAKSGTLAMTSDIPTVTNYYWANVRVSSSSSTSTSPTFSTAYTSNWFRSNGQTGWYSQTYGGGIYMADSSYVRVYGSKRFYAASGYLSPYDGDSWISMATRTNCIVAAQNNSASSAHALFRVKNSRGHAIAFGGLGASIGFYGFYASRISSGSNGTDWSTVWNVGTGVITHSKTIYTAGYYHRSVNSNNYVLLAGGSYKNLADFAKGNAGASNRGVYVTGGTVKAMTYELNATVNSGSSGKLAYYSGTNSIDDYTSTKGSSSTPIYLNAGVPTACSGVIVKYWGWYNINCYSGTTPTYSKKGGNFNFVTSVSRRSEGKYTVRTVYPSGYTWNNTIYWGSGRLNKGMSSNSSNSVLYVTMFNGYQSGSTYYLYVNTADDSSTNDGMFDVFFLCF